MTNPHTAAERRDGANSLSYATRLKNEIRKEKGWNDSVEIVFVEQIAQHLWFSVGDKQGSKKNYVCYLRKPNFQSLKKNSIREAKT